jgi:hypothetical protein
MYFQENNTFPVRSLKICILLAFIFSQRRPKYILANIIAVHTLAAYSEFICGF